MSETYRYFLSLGGGPKREVTKAEWVAAERSAGFRGGRPGEPSTGGFGNGSINGTIEYIPAGQPTTPQPVTWTLEPDQVDALKALLALVHRDELAESWWQSLPAEVREALS